MVSQSVREIERPILEEWLDLTGEQFEQFVRDGCGFEVQGEMVKVPLNKENEAKGTVVTENVKFDRKLLCRESMEALTGYANHHNTEFARVVRRAYEQPA